MPCVGAGAILAVREAGHERHQCILCTDVEVVVYLPVHLSHLAGRMEQALQTRDTLDH